MATDREHQVEVRAHAGTYDAFIGMMKWGTIAAFIVTLLVVWLIAA